MNIVNTTALYVHLIMVKMEIFMFVVFFPTHKRDIVPALKEIIEGSAGNRESAHLFIWQTLINGVPIMFQAPCRSWGEARQQNQAQSVSYGADSPWPSRNVRLHRPIQ